MLRRTYMPRSRTALWIVILAVVAALGALYRPSDRGVQGTAFVTDGDSLRVQGVVIRLKGVDAPELHQTCSREGRPYRCGEAARQALLERIAGRPVACRIEGRDRYRRSLARCRIDGQDLGAWLVLEGFAVGYHGYEAEESIARRRGVGLWAGEFERPSVWRQEHRAS